MDGLERPRVLRRSGGPPSEWAFLTVLRDEGRGAADNVCSAHADSIGVRLTFDPDRLLEGV